jgi:predicted MPP superfamily phosphohydrolase
MKPSVTKYTLSAPVPEKIDFLFLSDLHGCDNSPILDVIKSNPHDALLFGGDLVHDEKNFGRGLELLDYLSRSGETCFFSLGNHEHLPGIDVREKILKYGVNLLDDSSAEFMGITVAGLSSGEFHGGKPDIGYLEKLSKLSTFKLLLCHRPEYFPKYIRDLPIDLTLSGHAHGGQWRFFGRGVYAPGQGIFPKYTSGIYENRLIVGRGLGNPHLVPRINNHPEIVSLSLLPQNQK